MDREDDANDLVTRGEIRILPPPGAGVDSARTEAGWVRRFIVDAERVDEVVRLYESLGFEVALDPVPLPPVKSLCRECLSTGPEGFRLLYTRRRDAAEPEGTEGNEA